MNTRAYKWTRSTSGLVRRGCSGGFTLVELLVTIAIITVLVAILMPVIIQARNRGHAAACVSNLRQLGIAISGYADDWNGRLPRLSGTPFAGSAARPEWPEGSCASELRDALAVYLGNEKVLRCSSDLGSPEFGFSRERGSVFSRAGSSYTSWCAGRTGLYGLAVNGGRVSSLEPAHEHVLLRDYGSGWHGYRSRVGMDVTSRNTANCLFADGHVASTPVLRITFADREYACVATRPSASQGLMYFCGASGGQGVLLSGRRRIAGDESLEIALSGSVHSGGVDYSVDRVFRFSAGTEIDPAFRQIVNWVDSLVAW